MLSLGDGGALDYAMHAADTVQHALDTAARFIGLLNGELTIRIESSGHGAFVALDSLLPSPPAAEDFLMSAFYRVHLRTLLPEGAELTCHFTQMAPAAALHARSFPGCTLHFSAPRRGFAFAQRWLESRLISADSRLFAILVHYLERELADLPEGKSTAECVSGLLTQETPMRAVTLEAAARAVRMAPRTLSPRLQHEGTSFGELLDQVRRARATAYLTQRTAGVEDVALKMGFSRASSFHRAFKRWTGINPRQYKRAHREEKR